MEYKNGDTIEIKGTKSNVDNTATLTIINNSSASLNLTGGTQKTIISGTNASNFTATNPSLFTLIPGNSTSFTVNFKTNVLGDKVAELSIPNDDLTNSNFKLNLKGVFEPKETWVLSGNMNASRGDLISNILADGKIIVSGGYDGASGLLSSEILDPEIGNWSLTGNMSTQRIRHSSAEITGNQVLISGGYISGAGTVLNSSEIYNSNTKNWTQAGNMNTPRYGHQLIRLQNGKILAVGGSISNACGDCVTKTTEIFDPNTGLWSSTGSTNIVRPGDKNGILLNDGRVLIVGGYVGNWPPGYTISSSCEIYNPLTDNWTLTGSMNSVRSPGTFGIVLLNNGKVLVSGGFDNNTTTLSSTEIFDPNSGTWTVSTNMNNPRVQHTSVLLDNGNVIVIGGYFRTAGLTTINLAAELFNPSLGRWSTTAEISEGKIQFATKKLKSGAVIIIGGSIYNSQLASFPNSTKKAEIYFP